MEPPPPPLEMGASRRGGQRARGRPRGMLRDADRSILRAGAEGLAGTGTPEWRRMGVPGGSGAPAVRALCGTRGCSRCLAPGEARALPSLRSLSAFPPVTLPHPSASPSGGPRLTPRRVPAPLQARLFSRAPGSCSHGRASTRAIRGGAGGKQAAAAWLLIHHLQPPRGSARNASSRERWGRGEQGPPAPAGCTKMELWGCERRPKGDSWWQQRVQGWRGVSGRGKGGVRCSQSKGDVVPVAQRAPLRAAPSSASRWDAALLTHRLGVPQQHSPLRLPKKPPAGGSRFGKRLSLIPIPNTPGPAKTRLPRASPTPEPDGPSSTSRLYVTPRSLFPWATKFPEFPGIFSPHKRSRGWGAAATVPAR